MVHTNKYSLNLSEQGVTAVGVFVVMTNPGCTRHVGTGMHGDYTRVSDPNIPEDGTLCGLWLRQPRFLLQLEANPFPHGRTPLEPLAASVYGCGFQHTGGGKLRRIPPELSADAHRVALRRMY